MLKENWRLISRIEKVADMLVTILAFFAAYYTRNILFLASQTFKLGLPFDNQQLAPAQEYILILIIALISLISFLNITGAYGSMRLTSGWRLLQTFSITSFLIFINIAAILFILKADISRSLITLFCFYLIIFLTLERLAVLRLLRYWRRKGFNYRNVIVCGLNEKALKIAAEINQRPELGIRIRAYADLKSPLELPVDHVKNFKQSLSETGRSIKTRVIYGSPAIKNVLQEYAIDEIIFTEIANIEDLEEVMLSSAEQGVRTTVVADMFSIGLVKSGLSYFGSIPLIHYQTPPGDRWDLAIKRILDIVISAVLLILLSPLFLIITLLIKITSKGPILFIQKRVGLNGHLFNMYKFRSMYTDAEEKLAELKENNEMQGPAFKLKNDPRVTHIGHFLRKHSLDELPQLWNVLTGEMSLVGPRPPIPGEVSTYERHYRRRLSMRPGLTCTWQVSGRNKISDFKDWVKLDLEYIDNWSLSRDILLIFRTIPAIILGTGAR